MSADERMYNVHRCIQPTFAQHSRLSNYLEQCVQQLNACSHLYSEEVVCGAHTSFYQAHAQSLQIVSTARYHNAEDVYRSQLSAYKRLQRHLEDGEVRAAGTARAEGGGKGTYTVYKWTAGHVPSTPWHYLNQNQKEKPLAERELYDVGKGDESSNAFPRETPSLERPSPHGSFTAASKAFLNTHIKAMLPAPKLSAHEKKMVTLGVRAPPPETVEGYVSNASMTKFSALMDDLAELRTTDPDFRVVVFTRHTIVQERLVKLIGEETKPGGRLAPAESGAKLVVFEFTAKTAAQQRHRLIQQFQDGAKKGARVFVVTYAVAAVGITLTAANRIFLSA
jgi:hypothetical protein